MSALPPLLRVERKSVDQPFYEYTAYAATSIGSINAASSRGAFELFTRFDTG